MVPPGHFPSRSSLDAVGMRYPSICTVLALSVGVLSCSPGCTPAVTDAELVARCAKSQPSWQNYPEDIKAQVGAGPIAEWEGVPSQAQYRDGVLRVTFSVQGPWSRRDASVPVLLQDPTGRVHRNVSAECASGSVVYSFDLSKTSGETVPAWVELKFPHGTKRISLSERGEWRGAE